VGIKHKSNWHSREKKNSKKNENKTFALWYFAIGTFVLVIIGTVYSVLPNPGHPAKEIGGNNEVERTFNGTSEENFTFPTGLKVQGTAGINITNDAYAKRYFGDGKQLTNMSVIFLGNTTSVYQGNITYIGGLTGYIAANAACNAQYSGSHFCSASEMMQVIAIRGATNFIDSKTEWISNGPPGYLASANDCEGWTTNNNMKLGPFWSFNSTSGGMGWLVNCAQSKQLACCI
jgi:hypothetical protein